MWRHEFVVCACVTSALWAFVLLLLLVCVASCVCCLRVSRQPYGRLYYSSEQNAESGGEESEGEESKGEESADEEDEYEYAEEESDADPQPEPEACPYSPRLRS